MPAIESAHHPVSARNPDMAQPRKNPLTHRQVSESSAFPDIDAGMPKESRLLFARNAGTN
ncbi:MULTISPECIES: hypothetical protein [Rhizobium]|uniref:Uncharacterized protein n=1 Tax=Rhizobium esperanzae TaxID=1967781 RepID=A0A7W6ULF0_9HYPH|nr:MULTISPECIES: hypothetical protein [Rhizobium]MBB4440352.1 hypothetical protein [Rhizobium esperanzae]MDH6202996.1 hypothetical protein [Rhizobium leguminosarum]